MIFHHIMNACGLFISVFVGGGGTYECVRFPSHRLLLEKLSFSHPSMMFREVPGDWSLSVAVSILSNQLADLQVISASSHPTEKQTKPNKQTKKESSQGSWRSSALPRPCPP